MNKFLFCLNFVVCHFCHFVGVLCLFLGVCFVVFFVTFCGQLTKESTANIKAPSKQPKSNKQSKASLHKHTNRIMYNECAALIGRYVVKMMFVRESPPAIIFRRFFPSQSHQKARWFQKQLYPLRYPFGLIWRDCF